MPVLITCTDLCPLLMGIFLLLEMFLLQSPIPSLLTVSLQSHPLLTPPLMVSSVFLSSSLVSVLPPSTYLPLSLRMVDTIVGCWLLQPDHPVSSFLGSVKIILPSKIVSNPGSDQTAATHR